MVEVAVRIWATEPQARGHPCRGFELDGLAASGLRTDERLGYWSGCPTRPLTVVSGEDSANGKILVQIRPVQSERRKLDVVELVAGLTLQAWVAAQRKRDLQPALHHHVDLPISMMGTQRFVNQGAHSTYGL